MELTLSELQEMATRQQQQIEAQQQMLVAKVTHSDVSFDGNLFIDLCFHLLGGTRQHLLLSLTYVSLILHVFEMACVYFDFNNFVDVEHCFLSSLEREAICFDCFVAFSWKIENVFFFFFY